MRNRLADESSPYLRQHRDNPVHWQPWDDRALAQAKAERKPILLSVGYAACHWCHVMAHESFEDPAIAATMNADFINIKVDREERPDLDAIYQGALQMLGESGGWPLTMFLTPDGDPVWGGTYFPPESRYGRPGFPQVLDAVSRLFREDPEKVEKNVRALRDGLIRMSGPTPGDPLSLSEIDSVADRVMALIDHDNGGLRGAPKFPQCGLLGQLWRAGIRSGRAHFSQAVTHSLDRMCQGGIYDHLGGGFSRYATDERWLVPHFEKMLYDNADMIDLLTLVWRDTRSPLYAARVAETVGWILREMTHAAGGFYASLDADSEGEEGRFYVWSDAEVDAVLGDHAPLFKAIYDVTPDGNWEGRTILNRLRSATPSDTATEAALAECRADLLRERARRVPPDRDDKILADWNGLAIAAIARAGLVFGRTDWCAAAIRAFHFVADNMAAGDRLLHGWAAGQARHPATLDDYAAMCRAAVALYEATGDGTYLDRCYAWISVLDRHYADPAGGYLVTADDTADVILRTKTGIDAAVPSGNGMMAEVLARLHHLTGDPAARQRHEALLRAFGGAMRRNALPMSSLLLGQALMLDPVQVVIAGDPGAAATQALWAALHAVSLPNAIVTPLPPGAILPVGHPAAGKPGDAVAAYVCRGMTCSLPVRDPSALQSLLRDSRRAS